MKQQWHNLMAGVTTSWGSVLKCRIRKVENHWPRGKRNLSRDDEWVCSYSLRRNWCGYSFTWFPIYTCTTLPLSVHVSTASLVQNGQLALSVCSLISSTEQFSLYVPATSWPTFCGLLSSNILPHLSSYHSLSLDSPSVVTMRKLTACARK